MTEREGAAPDGSGGRSGWSGWGFRLRRLSVQRFAALRDVRLDHLGPGLTLLLGPNEAGKSTLLAFWVDMLYDLPAASRSSQAVDPYRPQPGEEWGGEVELESAAGPIRLRRLFHEGRRRAGRLWLERDGSSWEGEAAEAELERLLGQVARSDYTTVFAFSLAELEALRRLDQGEVGKRIYSAGFGAAEVPAVEDELERRRGELWKPRARKGPELNQLLQLLVDKERELESARHALGELEPLRAEQRRAEEEVARLEPLQAEAERQARRLRRLRELRPDWQRWRVLRGEVEAGRRWATFPAEATERSEELEERLRRLEEQRRQLRREVSGEEAILDEPLPVALLEAAAQVEALLRELPDQQRRAAALAEKEQRLHDAEAELEAAARRLRLDPDALPALVERWGETGLPEAEGQELAARAMEARKHALLARSRWEEQELGGAEAAVSAPDPGEAGGAGARGRRRGAVVVGLGLAGFLALGAALLHGPAWAGWLGLLAVGGALALALAPARGGTAAVREEVERARLLWESERRRLAQAREAAEREEAEARGRLVAWCRRHGLPTGLAPEELAGWLAEARRLPQLLAGRERLERELAELRSQSDAFAARLGEQAGRLGVEADPDRLRERLEAARRQQERRRQAAESLRRLRDREKELAVESAEAEGLLRSLLEKAGVGEVAELPEAAAQAERWRRQGAELQDLESRLRAAALELWPEPADPLAELDRRLAATDPEALEQEQGKAEAEAAEVRERIARAHQRLGELRVRIEQLERSRRVAELGDEAARLRARLEARAAEWRRLTLALEILRAARERFEQERQPAVVQSASRLFVHFTGGRYERVTVGLGEQRPRLVPRGAGAAPLEPWQLSRGTQEQLYLAMRLAYIEEVRRNGGSLPVVIDDALADFDPARLRAALRALGEFARGHQVLLFTCHPHVVDAARREVPDAHVLELP
ncbi:MAG: AAA family ATPase [Bacillota bacterium]|nr:AAA family ATPase [Bacillota bacterium]